MGNTARFLAKGLATSDFKVNVITPKFGKYSHLPSLEKRENITIYRLQMKERLLFWYKTALFSYFRRKVMKNTDLIHLLNMRDAPFIYRKCPAIVNVNDYVPSTIPLNPFKYPYNERQRSVKYFHYNFLKLLDFVSLKRADFIVPNSKYVWGVVSKAYGLKNKEHRIVYKGIDVREFRGSEKKEIDLLFVGSPFGQKGAREFIQAVSFLKKEYKNIKGVMIGRPSKIDYDYRLTLKKLGLEKNIEIIDLLPHQELIRYYLRSKMYVLPTYREALGQTILEAMAAKIPVISMKIGGIPEVVTRKTGILVEPTETKKIGCLTENIKWLLDNPEIRTEMGIRGYERVKGHFNFKEMIKEYMGIYNRFL